MAIAGGDTNSWDGPLVISSEPGLLPEADVDALDFKALVLRHLFE